MLYIYYKVETKYIYIIEFLYSIYIYIYNLYNLYIYIYKVTKIKKIKNNNKILEYKF